VSPLRRDAHGRLEAGTTWDSLVERLIQEAIDDGEFDDLPYRDQRLPLEDDSAAGDRAVAFRMLRNAGMAPPWIETDKEVRCLLDRIDEVIALGSRSREAGARHVRDELTRLVDQVNQSIARLNAEAPTDRQHRRPLEPSVVLRRLETGRPDRRS
jgi:hypothetical protein